MTEPLRIVGIGGGTGLPVLLRGLAAAMGSKLETRPECLTGIVTVTDDGGSSGRLRRGRGMLPPGDVRNCLVALGRDPHSLGELFQYRYRNGSQGSKSEDGLEGHTLGNLILTALAEKTGCFLEAIEHVGRVLAVRGRILPSTLEDVSLRAVMDDGSEVRGESAIAVDGRAIARVRLDPERPLATAGVILALREADLIVLAPGSLFSSLIPNLLVAGVTESIAESPALKILVGNLMTQAGETEGYDGEAHLRAIESYLGEGVLDMVLAPSDGVGRDAVTRYRREGQVPVRWSRAGVEVHGATLVETPLLGEGGKIRHDASALANCLLELASARRGQKREPGGSPKKETRRCSLG